MPQKSLFFEFVDYLIRDSNPDKTNVATKIKSNRTQT